MGCVALQAPPWPALLLAVALLLLLMEGPSNARRRRRGRRLRGSAARQAKYSRTKRPRIETDGEVEEAAKRRIKRRRAD